VPPTVNLRHAQKLKLAKARVSALVHGGSWRELASLLGFGRLGVEEGGEGLEVGGRVVRRLFHATSTNRRQLQDTPAAC